MSAQRHVSVWDALEDSPGTTQSMKVRSDLMQDLAAHISKAGMSHREAARQLDVPEQQISDLIRGNIDLLSIDALVTMLAEAGLQLDLRVQPRPLP